MPQDFLDDRDGGLPNTSIDPGNADGRVQVDAGVETFTLADWMDAWEQYEQGRQDEKDELDAEKAELEKELANTTDPDARAEIQQQLNEVAIDRSVVDAEYDLATNPFESRTGQFEPASYSDWAVAGGLDPYDPATAQTYNAHMPREASLGANNELNSAIESDNWFYFNVFKPIDMLSSIPINPAALLKGGLKKILRGGAKRGARKGRKLRPNRQERIKGRRKRRKERRDCKTKGNPAFIPTGIPVHVDPIFALEGLLPVEISSSWYGDIEQTGPLGRGRVSDFDTTIHRNNKGGFTFLDEDGFAINFDAPTPIPDGWVPGDTDRSTHLMQGRARALIFRERGITQTFQKFPDAIWRVVTIMDRCGNTVLLDRDAAGLLTRIATPEGLQLRFTNSPDGLRREVVLEGVDGAQRVVMRYDYANGLMTSAECPYGESHAFTYDDSGLMSGLVRNETYVAEFSHDAKGRRTRSASNRGFAPATFVYDDVERVTKFLPEGDLARAQTFHYGPTQTITQEISALGDVSRTIENDEGLIAAQIDAEGNETRYSYDADGNIASITDPEGRHRHFVWNEDGAITMAIDSAGKSWDYTYDDRGILVQVASPLGHTTEINNNQAGQPIGFCRHDGFIQQNSYNAHHWLMEMTDFDGSVTKLTRDGFGRITAIEAPDGSITAFAYDDQQGLDFSVPSAVTRADGVQTTTQVASQGRIVSQTDGEGHRAAYHYDGLGYLDRIIDPKGGVLRFHYDDSFALTKVENQIGRVWSVERDAAGRVIVETDFEGRVLHYAYDKADRLIETRYPDGRVMRFEWDKSGLLLSKTMRIPGHTSPYVESFSYDERGQLVTATNAAAVVSFEYDAAGRMIAETAGATRIESEIDCCGNRTARRIGDHLTTYRHDAMGGLTDLFVNGHQLMQRQFDENGREIRRTGAQGFALQNTYDSVSQLAVQTVKGVVEGVPTVWARRYEWSKVSAPAAIMDMVWGKTSFSADANGQILSAKHGGLLPDVTTPFSGLMAETEAFDYTPTLDIAASGDGGMLSWTSSDGGRVMAAHGPGGTRIRFTYDPNGRVTERRVEQRGFRPQVWTFTWDGFDRMIGVICPDGAAWAYIYDAVGRRIEKRLLRRGDSYPAPATRFIWDGNVIAAELALNENGDPEDASIVWWHFEPDGFAPLLREQGGTALHVVTDHLGTPRELIDERGAVAWSASHRLWGGLRGLWIQGRDTAAARDLSLDWDPTPDAARALCPIRFQGQWEDPETGLHYNRHRFYDPASTQYLSPDPIGITGGLRANGYVEIPVYHVDPLGLNRYPAWMPPLQGFQRHHIIPWHMRNDPFLRDIGFDANASGNMMYLPSRACSVAGGGTAGQRGSAQHRGFAGHDEYNRYMSGRLENVKRQTQGQSTRCQRLAVRRLQLETRTMLGTGALQIAQCKE